MQLQNPHSCINLMCNSYSIAFKYRHCICLIIQITCMYNAGRLLTTDVLWMSRLLAHCSLLQWDGSSLNIGPTDDKTSDACLWKEQWSAQCSRNIIGILNTFYVHVNFFPSYTKVCSTQQDMYWAVKVLTLHSTRNYSLLERSLYFEWVFCSPALKPAEEVVFTSDNFCQMI